MEFDEQLNLFTSINSLLWGYSGIGILMYSYKNKSGDKIMKTYRNNKGRLMVCYKKPDGSHTTKSYPRVIMEEKLGRKLRSDEEVHHKDHNPDNNDPNNLEVILKKYHIKRHAEENSKYKNKFMKCPWCECTFIWTQKQQSEATRNSNRKERKSRHIMGPFCSKHCSGAYTRQVQLGRIKN